MSAGRRRLVIWGAVGLLLLVPLAVGGYFGAQLFGPLPNPKLDWVGVVDGALDRQECYEAGQVVSAALARKLPGASAVALKYYEHPLCGQQLAASTDVFRAEALSEAAAGAQRERPGFFAGLGAAFETYRGHWKAAEVDADRFSAKAESGTEKALARDHFWLRLTCDVRLQEGKASALYSVRRSLATASGDDSWLKPGWERLYASCAARKLALARRFEAVAQAKPDHKGPIWWEGFARSVLEAKLYGSQEAQTAYSDAQWADAWRKANPGLL